MLAARCKTSDLSPRVPLKLHASAAQEKERLAKMNAAEDEGEGDGEAKPAAGGKKGKGPQYAGT